MLYLRAMTFRGSDEDRMSLICSEVNRLTLPLAILGPLGFTECKTAWHFSGSDTRPTGPVNLKNIAACHFAGLARLLVPQ